MKYHYIYKTTCLCGTLAGKYYIGKRTTEANPYNCGYAGSGTIIKDYFKKYGKVKGETYDIEILELNPDKDTNARREREILGDLFLMDQNCLNLKPGGEGGGAPGRHQSEETKKKISEAQMGHKSFLPEGFTLSENARRRLSEAAKGNHYSKGRPSPMKGKKHTEEARKKMSDKNIGKVVSEETKEKMRAAYNPHHFKKGERPWNYGKKKDASV